jgi:hypothetical protein
MSSLTNAKIGGSNAPMNAAQNFLDEILVLRVSMISP